MCASTVMRSYLWHNSLTRDVLVACVFHVVLGGGVFTPPLTRLVGHVAARGER